MSESEEKVIKTLEENDEFEDFPEDANWNGNAAPADAPNTLWEEDWDDDDARDDFTEKLRQELQRAQQ